MPRLPRARYAPGPLANGDRAAGRKESMMLSLLCLALVGSSPPVRHLVILGSSTPEGVGASDRSASWVGLYAQYAAALDPAVRITNLARSGYSPNQLLPSGDPERNISRALELGADAVLVNLPLGIAARAHEPSEVFLAAYREIRRLAEAGGARIWFTTSLPKDTVDDDGRKCLVAYRDAIVREFSPYVVDFWTPVAMPDGHIDPELNADGTHLNDAGHRLLFEEARRTGLLGERSMPSPARILFVGNSLVFAGGGIDLALQRLAASAGKEVDVVRQTVGGMRLHQHAGRPETLAAIDRGGFDFVVLQEYSAGPVLEREQFLAAGRELIHRVRQAGAKPILYLTWTYKHDFRGVQVGNRAMTLALLDAYAALGRETGTPLVPVGLAWQRALDETTLELYADEHHQNGSGAYLVACSFYSALYNLSPVGLPWHGDPALDDAVAATLQRLAWQSWVDYDRQVGGPSDRPAR